MGETVCVHENGNMQTVPPLHSGDQVEFKTFFGPSPAEFRIASLHHFSMELDLFDDPNVRLQFDG
jgi:hypothetical protein